MIRPLVIDDNARAKVASVVSYAMDHPYREGNPVPGDNPNYVAKLDTYRAVFTFTHHRGGVFRHLTISVPSSKYANPAAVFTIASLFGFTGWDEKTIDKSPEGWRIDINKKDHCVTVVQEI